MGPPGSSGGSVIGPQGLPGPPGPKGKRGEPGRFGLKGESFVFLSTTKPSHLYQPKETLISSI